MSRTYLNETYLYLYQDGKIGVSPHQPTDIDLDHIETGWLRVVKATAHIHCNAGGEFPVPDLIEINKIGLGDTIKAAVKDTRTDTPYHYVPEISR